MKYILILFSLLILNINLNAENLVGIYISQIKEKSNNNKKHMGYGFTYKWRSGGNFYAGVETNLYKSSDKYNTDIYSFLGIKITNKININYLYGINILYSDKLDNAELFGGGISYSIKNNYEISFSYKERNKNDIKNEIIGIGLNIKFGNSRR